jgi:hypothetical protein
MSQLVALKTAQGMIIASDRRVVNTHRGKTTGSLHRKLFPLGAQAAISTGGAAVGIDISKTLSRSIRESISLGFEDLESYVLQVFQREYDNFTARGAKWFADNPKAHRRACFALGAKDHDGKLCLGFYVSEEHGQPFRKAPLTTASVVMPRRLGLEARLSVAAKGETPLASLKKLTLQAFKQIEGVDDTVGGPFDFALFDQSGMRIETV